jgi:hypothetical protein
VACSAASSSTTATSAATASTTAAAAAAAREPGEPSPSLIRVGPGNEVVAGFEPAAATDVPLEGVAETGSGSAAAAGADLR